MTLIIIHTVMGIMTLIIMETVILITIVIITGIIPDMIIMVQAVQTTEWSKDEIQQALFAQGSASTVEQIKQRLDQYLADKCKGQDVNKVRIVLK